MDLVLAACVVLLSTSGQSLTFHYLHVVVWEFRFKSVRVRVWTQDEQQELPVSQLLEGGFLVSVGEKFRRRPTDSLSVWSYS